MKEVPVTYIAQEPAAVLVKRAFYIMALCDDLGSIPELAMKDSHTDRTKGSAREAIVVIWM